MIVSLNREVKKKMILKFQNQKNLSKSQKNQLKKQVIIKKEGLRL